jgi:hypothetical protein
MTKVKIADCAHHVSPHNHKDALVASERCAKFGMAGQLHSMVASIELVTRGGFTARNSSVYI